MNMINMVKYGASGLATVVTSAIDSLVVNPFLDGYALNVSDISARKSWKESTYSKVFALVQGLVQLPFNIVGVVARAIAGSYNKLMGSEHTSELTPSRNVCTRALSNMIDVQGNQPVSRIRQGLFNTINPQDDKGFNVPKLGSSGE